MNSIERQLKAFVWLRDNLKCRRCHRRVYQTYKMPAQGVIHHVNRDLLDNSDVNLILVCYDCLRELSRLYLKYPAKYLCQMELITQTKLQSLRDIVPKYDIGYRYQKVSRYIEDLEYENNMLVLPSIDQEQLKRLKALKAKIEVEEIKAATKKMKIEEYAIKTSQTLASKFAKMEEDAIIELLNITQVTIPKDKGIVESLDERDFKIYGREIANNEPNALKSTWVLEHNGIVITHCDVVLIINKEDKS